MDAAHAIASSLATRDLKNSRTGAKEIPPNPAVQYSRLWSALVRCCAQCDLALHAYFLHRIFPRRGGRTKQLQINTDFIGGDATPPYCAEPCQQEKN